MNPADFRRLYSDPAVIASVVTSALTLVLAVFQHWDFYVVVFSYFIQTIISGFLILHRISKSPFPKYGVYNFARMVNPFIPAHPNDIRSLLLIAIVAQGGWILFGVPAILGISGPTLLMVIPILLTTILFTASDFGGQFIGNSRPPERVMTISETANLGKALTLRLVVQQIAIFAALFVQSTQGGTPLLFFLFLGVRTLMDISLVASERGYELADQKKFLEWRGRMMKNYVLHSKFQNTQTAIAPTIIEKYSMYPNIVPIDQMPWDKIEKEYTTRYKAAIEKGMDLRGNRIINRISDLKVWEIVHIGIIASGMLTFGFIFLMQFLKINPDPFVPPAFFVLFLSILGAYWRDKQAKKKEIAVPSPASA